MPLYKIAYTLETEMYLEEDSRSKALSEFYEKVDIEIAIGNALSVSDVHIEFIDGDKFADLHSLVPGDEIVIEINGGHEEPATGRIVEIEYLDGNVGEIEAANITLDNGWKGIVKLSEII